MPYHTILVIVIANKQRSRLNTIMVIAVCNCILLEMWRKRRPKKYDLSDMFRILFYFCLFAGFVFIKFCFQFHIKSVLTHNNPLIFSTVLINFVNEDDNDIILQFQFQYSFTYYLLCLSLDLDLVITNSWYILICFNLLSWQLDWFALRTLCTRWWYDKRRWTPQTHAP